jgi:hypothetical protein
MIEPQIMSAYRIVDLLFIVANQMSLSLLNRVGDVQQCGAFEKVLV